MTRFPGRFGAFALVAGPLLFVTGIATLLGVAEADTADQLDKLAAKEGAATLGFGLLVVAYVLLAFAIITLAGQVYDRMPRLGAVAGSMAIAALFGLVFFMGINYVQRQLSAVDDRATIVAALETEPFSPVIPLLPLCMLGFPLLGYAAYRAGVLPLWGAIGLAMMMLLPVGIIGGIPVVALVGTVGVAAALLPLGLRLWSAAEGSTSAS